MSSRATRSGGSIATLRREFISSTAAEFIAVRVARGARYFTMTRLSASSRRSASENPRMANLVAEYATYPGKPMEPKTEPTLTIAADSRALSHGRRSRHRCMGACTIDGETLVDLLRRQVLVHRERIEAGVVDEHVDPAMPLPRDVAERGPGRALREIRDVGVDPIARERE